MAGPEAGDFRATSGVPVVGTRRLIDLVQTGYDPGEASCGGPAPRTRQAATGPPYLTPSYRAAITKWPAASPRPLSHPPSHACIGSLNETSTTTGSSNMTPRWASPRGSFVPSRSVTTSDLHRQLREFMASGLGANLVVRSVRPCRGTDRGSTVSWC